MNDMSAIALTAETETAQKKVFIRTYGCQMNVYDSTRMEAILAGEGYAQAAAPEEADLVILNTNPLDNIRNSLDIRYVVKNGEVYEGATLNRVWPSAKPFPKPHWVQERERLEALRK